MHSMTDRFSGMPPRRAVAALLNAARGLLRQAVDLVPHADEGVEIKALLATLDTLCERYRARWWSDEL